MTKLYELWFILFTYPVVSKIMGLNRFIAANSLKLNKHTNIWKLSTLMGYKRGFWVGSF